MFKQFTAHFFHIVWEVREVLFGQIVLIVSGATIIGFVEKMSCGDAPIFLLSPD